MFPKSVKDVPTRTARSFKQAKNKVVQKEAKLPTWEERNCDVHGRYLQKMFELYSENKATRRYEMYLGILRMCKAHLEAENNCLPPDRGVRGRQDPTLKCFWPSNIEDSAFWEKEYWVETEGLRLYSIYKPKISDFRYFVLFQIYSNSVYVTSRATTVTSTSDGGTSPSNHHVMLPSELPQRKSDEWVIKWMFVDVKDSKNFERQIVLMQGVMCSILIENHKGFKMDHFLRLRNEFNTELDMGAMYKSYCAIMVEDLNILDVPQLFARFTEEKKKRQHQEKELKKWFAENLSARGSLMVTASSATHNNNAPRATTVGFSDSVSQHSNSVSHPNSHHIQNNHRDRELGHGNASTSSNNLHYNYIQSSAGYNNNATGGGNNSGALVDDIPPTEELMNRLVRDRVLTIEDCDSEHVAILLRKLSERHRMQVNPQYYSISSNNQNFSDPPSSANQQQQQQWMDSNPRQNASPSSPAKAAKPLPQVPQKAKASDEQQQQQHQQHVPRDSGVKQQSTPRVKIRRSSSVDSNDRFHPDKNFTRREFHVNPHEPVLARDSGAKFASDQTQMQAVTEDPDAWLEEEDTQYHDNDYDDQYNVSFNPNYWKAGDEKNPWAQQQAEPLSPRNWEGGRLDAGGYRNDVNYNFLQQPYNQQLQRGRESHVGFARQLSKGGTGNNVTSESSPSRKNVPFMLSRSRGGSSAPVVEEETLGRALSPTRGSGYTSPTRGSGYTSPTRQPVLSPPISIPANMNNNNNPNQAYQISNLSLYPSPHAHSPPAPTANLSPRPSHFVAVTPSQSNFKNKMSHSPPPQTIKKQPLHSNVNVIRVRRVSKSVGSADQGYRPVPTHHHNVNDSHPQYYNQNVTKLMPGGNPNNSNLYSNAGPNSYTINLSGNVLQPGATSGTDSQHNSNERERVTPRGNQSRAIWMGATKQQHQQQF